MKDDNLRRKSIKEQRKDLIKRTRDKINNVHRANEKPGGECIVCGNEIKKNQAFRSLPKDRKCKEYRFYHARTCGPGSNNWKAFKADGKKAPEQIVVKGQLSFKWESVRK